MSERFRTFAGTLLEANDALVSAVDPMGMEVILPVSLQQSLGLPEHAVLAFSGESADGWYRVMLESDWLERFGGLLAEHGKVVRLPLSASAVVAPSNPERVLEHQLRLNNAVYRLQGVEESWTRCILHTFRYSAVSDEKRDGLVWTGRNLSNGAVLDEWVDVLSSAARAELLHEIAEPGKKRLALEHCPEAETEEEWGRLTQRLVPSVVHRHLHAFLSGLHRRQQRDLDRLHGYHTDLRQEVFARMAAARKKGEEKWEEERQRGKLRLEAVAREYHAKAADLWEKYALTIKVEHTQSVLLESRVIRFRLLIKRRKGERLFHLDWHPTTRQLELPPCEAGLPFGAERMVCDDALHVVSVDGLASCAGCDKPFCRACHPDKCPRCGRWHRQRQGDASAGDHPI
ncbi:MAG: hypothetical protein HQM04_09145 [Magnetococcales bacterium]|nr:hypothetical protein [Magnetococcales bacterium]MBF0115197.1 hypothetical protein [Magnetococcales bacterium]